MNGVDKKSREESSQKEPKIGDIFGVNVFGSRMGEVLTIIKGKMINKANKKPFFVVTVNPEFVVLAQKDAEFRNILNSADLAIADGVGLRLVGVKNIVPGRILVEKLLGGRIFYLGGRNGVSRMMAEKYGGEYDSGAVDIKSQISNPKKQTMINDQIIKKINNYKPDLLLVAYGAPWQEKWIYRHLDKIEAKVVMGVGGTLDYLTGISKVPPNWISGAGLEWLWRLVHEPWRWRRQLTLIQFVGMILTKR